MDSYETVQVLSDSIIDRFANELRPHSTYNESSNVNRLESSLKELKYAINKNALPEVVMEIVHVQIHPLLQNIYNLRLVK
jgi:hypothetical protein